jgi:hypothetical protein
MLSTGGIVRGSFGLVAFILYAAMSGALLLVLGIVLLGKTAITEVRNGLNRRY